MKNNTNLKRKSGSGCYEVGEAGVRASSSLSELEGGRFLSPVVGVCVCVCVRVLFVQCDSAVTQCRDPPVHTRLICLHTHTHKQEKTHYKHGED